jgi:hypothetical protein
MDVKLELEVNVEGPADMMDCGEGRGIVGDGLMIRKGIDK